MLSAIDMFSGLGGFTAGARAAGIRVLWAANHWQSACDAHAANHPETQHVCQDLQQANFLETPGHDLLLCSPCCHGHSWARGKDRPEHDGSRATAWAPVSCAEIHRPIAIVLENVVGFLRWLLFPAWEHALQRLGYTLSVHHLDAADHGVPQHRRRIFIIATRSRAQFTLRQVKRPHVPFRSVMDRTATNWSPVASKCQRTRQRVANGRLKLGREFLISYYSSGSGLAGRSLDRPLGTITTKDRWAVVDGDMLRMLTVEETRLAMGFPEGYRVPPGKNLAKHLYGNAVPPPVVTDVLSDLCTRI